MKVLLYGKNSQEIKQTVENLSFEVVTVNPDVVISYGGDGTLLTSEREFPEIPKLPIRDSKVCNKCSDHTTEKLLLLLKESKLTLTEEPKLETEFEGNKMIALNDLVVRNISSYHAIRFYLTILRGGGKRGAPSTDRNEVRTLDGATNRQDPEQKSLIIGDGIVASTPFGSTGYYKSITKKTFSQNFRIAFNNIIGDLDPLEFSQNDLIKLQIVRGPANLTSDNNPETIELIEGNEIIIQSSSSIAKIYSPQTLRCTNCQVRRDERLHS